MIKTVGVIGAGTMGNGIAQVFAQSGFHVVLQDVAQPALDRARTTIDKSLSKFVEKGKLAAADREAALSRLVMTTDVGSLAEVDYVVEAAVEQLDLKRRLFADLDRITRPGVMLTSNTSSISITTLGAATRRPELVLGMHFMNPVPLMVLVELIRGQATSPDAMATATALCVQLGKTPVEASDYPGFIANRVLMPMINEAIFAVMEGVGTPEAIDTVMIWGDGHRRRPRAGSGCARTAVGGDHAGALYRQGDASDRRAAQGRQQHVPPPDEHAGDPPRLQDHRSGAAQSVGHPRSVRRGRRPPGRDPRRDPLHRHGRSRGL
jgi:3-hydroxybutyryl-CoA dehydrogenase